MTPHLALTLSFEGIGLARRTDAGWDDVGRVALDAADLPERLRALRDTARSHSPDGIATTVVLPDEQILNRHLPEVAANGDAVAAALDGLTPYAVADLVFDWRPHADGGVVVAAVARETLDEALSFARQHGFNPVALTAWPGPDLPFADHPKLWTGSDAGAPTAAEAAPKGASIQLAAPDVRPETAQTTPYPTGTAAETPSELSVPAVDAAARDATVEAVEASLKGEPTGEHDGFATRRGRRSQGPDAADDVSPDGTTAAPFLLECPTQFEGSSETSVDGLAADRLAALPGRLTVLQPVDRDGDNQSDAADSLTASPSTDKAADTPDPRSKPASDSSSGAPPLSEVTGSDVLLSQEDAVSGPEPAGKASAPPDDQTTTPKPAATAGPAATPGHLAGAGPKPGATRSAPAGRPVAGARRGPRGKSGAPVGAPRNGKAAGSGQTPRVPVAAPVAVTGASDVGVSGKSGMNTANVRLVEPSVAARVAGASLGVRPLGDPTLVGGARAVSSLPVVLGLVIALVIALAAAVGLSRVVIGWLAPPADVAAISPDAPMVTALAVPEPATPADSSGTGPESDTAPGRAALVPQVAAPDDGQSLSTSAALPDDPGTGTLRPEFLELEAPGAEVVAETGTGDIGEAPPVAVASDGEPTAGTGPSGTDVSRPAPDTVTAASAAPPRLASPGSVDSLPAIPSQFVLGPGPEPVPDPARPAPVTVPPQASLVPASFDPLVTLQDPLALLPPAARNDTSGLLTIQRVPPPDAIYRLDPQGLVIATPEGAVSPDGHLVTLGRPPLVAPARPLTAAPAPAIASDPAAVQRLARLRPPPRPPVPDTSEASLGEPEAEDAAPDGVASPQASPVAADTGAARTPDAATVRPLPRPAALSRATTTATPATPTAFATATAQAIPVSLRPLARPAGIDAIAAAAAVRIAPLPQSDAPAPRAAPDFDYDDGEPEAVAAAPRIPSSASVARQATVEGALNLRELNLIGVYGTASDRRALVRLPNGRFVKVEIGDRVDGGQVADIGDRDLRYIKGGRSFVLSMPRG